MTSIEKQDRENQAKPKDSSNNIKTIIDNKKEIPVVITLIQGQSGTLYRNQSSSNGIPDKLLV